MRRRIGLAGLVVLTACGSPASLPSVAIAPTAQALALTEDAVSRASGAPLLGALREVRFYQRQDGTVACGTWAAPDVWGGFAASVPFYVRFAGQSVAQVHLDDTTGYGIARIGCRQVAQNAAG